MVGIGIRGRTRPGGLPRHRGRRIALYDQESPALPWRNLLGEGHNAGKRGRRPVRGHVVPRFRVNR